MAFSMTDEELKKRIRNGTPIKILAELNGVSDQTIYNWMKKNGVDRPRKEPEGEKTVRLKKKILAEPEKEKTAQVVAKVIPVEIKIEVDGSTFNAVNRQVTALTERIESLKKDIVFYEEQIESWKKILAVLKQKEAPKDD